MNNILGIMFYISTFLKKQNIFIEKKNNLKNSNSINRSKRVKIFYIVCKMVIFHTFMLSTYIYVYSLLSCYNFFNNSFCVKFNFLLNFIWFLSLVLLKNIESLQSCSHYNQFSTKNHHWKYWFSYFFVNTWWGLAVDGDLKFSPIIASFFM